MSGMHHAPIPDDLESGDDLERVPVLHHNDSNHSIDSNGSRAWSFNDVTSDAAGIAVVSPEPNNTTTATTTPHASLFSTGTPPTSSSPVTDTTRTHVNASSSSNSSRSLSVLASAANMTRRTARLTVPDERPQPPIVQLSAQIPSAQKDIDDPTTPIENRRSQDGGISREYATLTTLSRLFAGDTTTMPNSRTPSYNHAAGPLYLRASSESISLPDHLYTRGLLEGRHSDITVVAFGKEYHLHRLILDRAPFFTTALSEPWLESQSKEVKLYPEEIDVSITQAAFDLAIKKLYGVDISKECDAEAIGLFATGCWLEMQDLIDGSIESILRQMNPENLAPLIRLVTMNYYGRSGERILESAKAMLSRNGWEMPLKYWDGMPGDIIREMVASDGFFVDSEWDRWVLCKRLLDRRLRQAALDAGLIERGQKPIPKAPDSLRLMAIRFDAVYRQNSLTVGQPVSDKNAEWTALYTNPDIERVLVLLDEGIHYIHMDYEQLQFIRTARDIFGLPVMPDKVISDALWQQLALRQKVLSADESAQELGLCKTAPDPVTTAVRERGSSSRGKNKTPVTSSTQEDEDVESGSWDGNGKPRKFWIPSSDCNIVLGNGADPVVTTSSSFQRHATRLSATLQPEDAQWATDFASSPSTMANPNTRADHPARPISAGGSNAGQPNPIAYTEFPPFRFSAEFPNPRFLKEKKRVYSRTVSYAGSLWNIYIQKVRSAKNVQLGVYLHRAKEREGEEHSSGLSQQNAASVDERIGQLERELLVRSERRDRRRDTRALPPPDPNADDDTSGSGGDPDNLTSTGSRNPLFASSTTMGRRRGLLPLAHVSRSLSSPFQPGEDAVSAAADGEMYPSTLDTPSDDDAYSLSSDDEEMSAYPNPTFLHMPRKSRNLSSTLPSYVDARPTIKTYFKIYSPSKGGRMLSIYESAPDRFNFSQSWGWKSSTLMLDEVALHANGKDEDPLSSEVLAERRRSGGGKLRFMVVIGNL
ncbi:hypothetical protein BU24DRAFT_81386 [Aaosphaeria arxii CBS 175.79]|uniref:BTB domain-containing protein n=1 Tax=Aaosphaeria arxii CBS 175.79 TaxID=1450172 RepID=A0A6A5X9Y7_9PLEO|nr:uncharacterized protein BU24DRAFT_81386 [Aaosphaeria arxii CBS 175.79]KAF2009730.1 hypothetical protein BU24DRAFT_81386 [Aaosphaeria arxii CBS 175.79]